MIKLGQQFGNFLVKAEIGRGGMGTIYYALDTMLEREVALKVIHEQYTSNPQLMERFKIEAMAQARMNHQNIVMIYSFNQIEGQYVIAMEFIYGRSLRDLLQEKKILELELAINYLDQILDGLIYAHSHKVIHRDIKPANILVSNDNRIKISDFGIAKYLGTEGLTKTGMMVGTPWYTSPEQILGHNIDYRSDLYSLGITFYEMITGKVPFDSETNSEFQIQKAHLETPPTRPSIYNPLIGFEIEKFVLKALQKNPDRRFQTAQEMKEELKKLKKEITRITTSSVPLISPRQTTYKKKQKKSPKKILLLIPAALIVLLAGYFLVVKEKKPSLSEAIVKEELKKETSEQERTQTDKTAENHQETKTDATLKPVEQVKESETRATAREAEENIKKEPKTEKKEASQLNQKLSEEVVYQKTRPLSRLAEELENLHKLEFEKKFLQAEALIDRLILNYQENRVIFWGARIKFMLEKFEQSEQYYAVVLKDGFPLDFNVHHLHLEDNSLCSGRWRWNNSRFIFNSHQRPEHSFIYQNQMIKNVQAEEERIVVWIEDRERQRPFIFTLPEAFSSRAKVNFLIKIINKYLLGR